MKIVYCHNYYRHRGGEDVSFETDVKMLRDEGHTVIPFTRDNRELSSNQLKVAAQTLWNRETYKAMCGVFRSEKPDVLHCNNLFPQISVSVYHAARKFEVPVVQALRNYRSFCASSFLYRDGNVCTKCLTKAASWHGLKHKCYHDSLAASSVVVAMQAFHRLINVQRRYVDAYFTPTAFSRQIHIDGGFEPDKLFVRCNFLIPDRGMVEGDQGYGLFVGRLSEEKGCGTMIDAWIRHRIPVPLRIVGDGPAEQSLRKRAEGHDQIKFVGKLEIEEVLNELTGARFLVMPSQWYETFGRTIAESFSRGTPVVASRLGAMSELVEEGRNGYLFEPGDSQSLANAIESFLIQYDVDPIPMQQAARRTYERRFTRQQSYVQLLRVYESAINSAGSFYSVQYEMNKAVAALASSHGSAEPDRLIGPDIDCRDESPVAPAGTLGSKEAITKGKV